MYNVWRTDGVEHQDDVRKHIRKPAMTLDANTCVVYSDLLLDDLCALEELGHRYDNLYLIAVNLIDLHKSPYSSDRVHTMYEAYTYVKKWFKDVVVTSKTVEYNGDNADAADCYLLCKATKIVSDLESGVKFAKITAMIGSDTRGRFNDEEWNASQDIVSYQKLLKNYEVNQLTHNDCIKLYELRGYGGRRYEFLQEYVSKMTAINEDICCFDLQVVLCR